MRHESPRRMPLQYKSSFRNAGFLAGSRIIAVSTGCCGRARARECKPSFRTMSSFLTTAPSEQLADRDTNAVSRARVREVPRSHGSYRGILLAGARCARPSDACSGIDEVGGPLAPYDPVLLAGRRPLRLLRRQGAEGPLRPPPFDRFAVERPKRGLTNERGPSLETPAPLKPAVDSHDRSPDPARQPALAPGLSNARGGFCRVQTWRTTPQEPRLSPGVPCTRRISGSPHPCGHEREAGGQGRLSCRVRGPIRRWSGLERAGLETGEEFGSRLRRSIASVEGMGAHEMTGDGGA
jgi:hypothetical protein